MKKKRSDQVDVKPEGDLVFRKDYKEEFEKPYSSEKKDVLIESFPTVDTTTSPAMEEINKLRFGEKNYEKMRKFIPTHKTESAKKVLPQVQKIQDALAGKLYTRDEMFEATRQAIWVGDQLKNVLNNNSKTPIQDVHETHKEWFDKKFPI